MGVLFSSGRLSRLSPGGLSIRGRHDSLRPAGNKGPGGREEVFGLSGGRWDDSNGTTVWKEDENRPSQSHKPDGED